VMVVTTMRTRMMIMYPCPVERKTSRSISIEKRRPFLPRPVPPIYSKPEKPAPDERIPVGYVNMFLTDNMIDNLVEESNKYATEKTGSCPNFTIYFGIYYLMGDPFR
jgi:hypothetical protein